MLRNLDAWKRLQDATRPAPAESPRHLRLMAQAEASAEHLTADPHWDHFLRLLSAARGRVTEARAAYEAILRDPRVVEHDALLRAKMALQGLQWQDETLAWAMELPKALIENGKAARELLVQRPAGGDRVEAGDGGSEKPASVAQT